MTDNDCTATEHERPWVEYRTNGDGPWREREFDTIEQVEAWACEHLGVDVADVSIVHVPRSSSRIRASGGETPPPGRLRVSAPSSRAHHPNH